MALQYSMFFRALQRNCNSLSLYYIEYNLYVFKFMVVEGVFSLIIQCA